MSRRGRNTASFELVERTERKLVASGRAKLPSRTTAANPDGNGQEIVDRVKGAVS